MLVEYFAHLFQNALRQNLRRLDDVQLSIVQPLRKSDGKVLSRDAELAFECRDGVQLQLRRFGEGCYFGVPFVIAGEPQSVILAGPIKRCRDSG